LKINAHDISGERLGRRRFSKVIQWHREDFRERDVSIEYGKLCASEYGFYFFLIGYNVSERHLGDFV
jgi:hypothetical protein